MASTNADTITPGVATGARTDLDGPVDAAAQAGLRARQHPLQSRPTRAATSTGCCCSAQAALDRRRLLHRVLGDARPAPLDPYTFVTRQVIFAIVAAVAMVVVMVVRLRVAASERARTLYVLTVARAVRAGRVRPWRPGRAMLAFDVGPIQIQPAEFAKFTVLLALCCLPQRGAQRRGVSYAALPRRR